jgi:hypothetical protein
LEQVLLDSVGKRSLHGIQEVCDLAFRVRGPNKQMYMFRHINESKKIKGMSGTSGFNALREKDSPSIGHKKRQTVITGKSKFMSVAGLIEMTDLLSMRSKVSHARLYQKIFGRSKRSDRGRMRAEKDTVNSLADKPPVAPRHPGTQRAKACLLLFTATRFAGGVAK